jgi:hypothetical protein
MASADAVGDVTVVTSLCLSGYQRFKGVGGSVAAGYGRAHPGLVTGRFEGPDDSRDMRVSKRFEGHKSIVRVSSNQTANSGKIFLIH